MPFHRNPVNGLVSKGKFIYVIGGLNDKKEWDPDCYSYNL